MIHITWSSEVALSLITGAQRPLRSPLQNVTISVVILLFGFVLFYVELQMVGKDSEPLRWQPAISGSRIQTLQQKKSGLFHKGGIKTGICRMCHGFSGESQD